MRCCATTPLIVALSPGHSDTTRFRPWSPIAPDKVSFGSCWKNSKSCSDDWHHWCFWSTFRHFGTQFAESFLMSKSSWMMDPTHSREMSGCSAFDLAEIRWSSKISLWIWSIISRVVTVLDCPGQSTSTCLNWATQFLMTYYGACSPNVSVRMAWISFDALPWREKTWMTARVLMLLKSRASLDMLPFSLCNKKRHAIWHMNRPLFPMTLSILSYDIVK